MQRVDLRLWSLVLGGLWGRVAFETRVHVEKARSDIK
jgi:hypothetical protein